MRTRLLCLLYIVAIAAAGLAVDRAIAHRLFHDPGDYVPAYRAFPEYEFGVKLQQLEQDDTDYDSLFIGNSRTLFGVDPLVVDARLRERGARTNSYNLAFTSVDARFWPDFFRRYYDRRPPKRLYLNLGVRDLHPSFTFGDDLRTAFFTSAGFRSRNRSPINGWAEERMSELFRMRGRAADTRLLKVGDVLRGERLDLKAIHLSNERGWADLGPRTIPRAELAREARRLRERHGEDPFVLGEEHRRSLIWLNDWMRRRGGCLTIYTTPLLYDRERYGTIEMREGFARELRLLMRDLPGARLVDAGARGRYGLADFGDGDHLSPRGAVAFSRRLADDLAPDLRPGARCAR